MIRRGHRLSTLSLSRLYSSKNGTLNLKGYLSRNKQSDRVLSGNLDRLGGLSDRVLSGNLDRLGGLSDRVLSGNLDRLGGLSDRVLSGEFSDRVGRQLNLTPLHGLKDGVMGVKGVESGNGHSGGNGKFGGVSGGGCDSGDGAAAGSGGNSGAAGVSGNSGVSQKHTASGGTNHAGDASNASLKAKDASPEASNASNEANNTNEASLTEDVEFNEIKSESNLNEPDTSPTTTGVIDKKSKEIVLFYNHIYPLPTTRFSSFNWISLTINVNIEEKIKKISGNNNLPIDSSNYSLETVVPLKRDSGAFAKFTVPPNTTSENFVKSVQENVSNYVKSQKKNVFYYLFSFLGTYPSVYPVKGTPWIEDLKRFPSPTLKINFEGNALTEEELYLLFRRYGVIEDILPGKELANVIFKHIRSAISAKNCITGISLSKGKTILHIQYVERKKKFSIIKDLITQHQKIAIPIIIALLTASAVLIFDPIREWFIETKITKKYSIEHYKKNSLFQWIIFPFETIKNWLGSSYEYVDNFVRHADGDAIDEDDIPQNFDSDMVWYDRYEKGKQLKLWIYENVGTFIIVRGPKGSGKIDFVVDNVLKTDEKLNQKILHIDCEEINKSRSTNSLLKNTANQVGFFPLFTWTNSITQFVDLAVQGISGQKSGLSETKETQFKNMLQLVTQAIRSITLKEYESYKSHMTRKLKKTNKDLDDDEKVEVLKFDAFLQLHPELKPIIIIDKFFRTRENGNEFINPTIAEWASNLIQNNFAHIIYVTSDVGSISLMNEALPNQVFKEISLSDASPSTARQYLQSQLKSQDTSKFSDCLDPLGGRMTDLQAFIRRVKSGEEPREALDELVNQASEQITTFFLNSVNNDWNSAQVWFIMKLLSENDKIDIQDILKNPLFGRSQKTMNTLVSLEKHDLIELHHNKGALDKIEMGRPLFHSAFQTLINDSRIFKIYEIEYLNKLIATENEKLRKLQDEIKNIYPVKLHYRVEYLSQKIEKSTKNVIEYENQVQMVLAS